MDKVILKDLQNVDAGLVRVSFYTEDGTFTGYGYFGPGSWPRPVNSGNEVVLVNEDGSPATA